MCGIFSVLSKKNKLDINSILSSYETGKKRGPESSKINMINNNIIFGFHRLAYTKTRCFPSNLKRQRKF